MVGSHHTIPKDPRGNWSQLPATILIGPETSWMLFCGAFIRFFYQNFGGFTLADTVVKTPGGKALTCEKGFFLGHYLEEPEVRLVAVGGLWRVCGESRGNAFRYRGPEGDLGYSVLVTLYGFRIENVFIGGLTSTLCIKRSLLLRFFPFSDRMLSDWRVRADNVLVIGSAVVGGRKFSLPSSTVGYRLHGSNHFAGVDRSKSDNTQELLVTERLFGDLHQKAPYPLEARTRLAVEYRGIGNRDKTIRKRYYRVILGSGMSFLSLVKNLLVMLKADLRP